MYICKYVHNHPHIRIKSLRGIFGLARNQAKCKRTFLSNRRKLSFPIMTPPMRSIPTLSDQIYPNARITQRMSQSTASTSPQFVVDTLTEKDSKDAIAFLKRYFFKDEPLNKCLKLGECKELENYSLKCIPSQLSYKATGQNGNIMAIILNDILHKPIEGQQQAPTCEHPKFKKILTMIDYIDTQFNIFDLYPHLDQVAEGKIIAVSSEYRELGLAKELIDRTLAVLKNRDIKILTALCSSAYSARALKSLDFREVYRLCYADYRVDGEVVFNPEPPHDCARILVKEIK